MTVMSRLSTCLAVPFALVMLVQVSAQTSVATFLVNVMPSDVHPGDVVRVQIPGVETFSATAFGKPVQDGLIGVDLDTKAGSYRLRVETPDGRVATRTIQVLPKTFPIRRLRVPPGFVSPPVEELERISRELKTTEGLFHTTTPRKWTGAFLLPVDGTPTSNFGTRSYYNGQRRSPHAGVDFVGEPGTPIRAANDGIVALAEPLYFTGNTVIIDYGGGLYSLFAHLSEFRVKSGDAVAPDTTVGLVGATGRVTGPHLHWSVRLQGARVDPLSLVAATAAQTK
jgi:murein DD-endopeptidase MepM/ murein hydrolase activator NlpD